MSDQTAEPTTRPTTAPRPAPGEHTSTPDLRDRVALITGAAGGLGPVVAADLAAHGARLGLVGSSWERLDRLTADLALLEGRWATVAADLRDEETTRAAVAEVTERLGPPTILVHLVGGWTGGKALVDLVAADLASMLDQHAWSTFNVLRAVVPGMISTGWGRIIAVSSPAAADPPARTAAYAAGKAAQEAILASLSKDLSGTGVTVNVLRVVAIDVAHERDRQPSARNAGWTTPEEIAAAIRYLCSPEAGVVSGARLALVGG